MLSPLPFQLSAAILESRSGWFCPILKPCCLITPYVNLKCVHEVVSENVNWMLGWDDVNCERKIGRTKTGRLYRTLHKRQTFWKRFVKYMSCTNSCSETFSRATIHLDSTCRPVVHCSMVPRHFNKTWGFIRTHATICQSSV